MFNFRSFYIYTSRTQTIKTATLTMRTNLKQQLMRQQMVEQEEKRRQAALRAVQSASTPAPIPSATPKPPIVNVPVPAHVLRVSSFNWIFPPSFSPLF